MHNLLAVEECQSAGNISSNPPTPVQSTSNEQTSGLHIVSGHIAVSLAGCLENQNEM